MGDGALLIIGMVAAWLAPEMSSTASKRMVFISILLNVHVDRAMVFLRVS